MQLPELYLSFRQAAFQATVAQLVVDPWTFHASALGLMPGVLAAALAPFLEVKIDPDHVEDPRGSNG